MNKEQQPNDARQPALRQTNVVRAVHTTIGVYANGEFKMNGVPDADLAAHTEYNINFRWGRALFVDGVCVYKGYLSDEQIAYHTILFNSDEKYWLNEDTAPYH